MSISSKRSASRLPLSIACAVLLACSWGAGPARAAVITWGAATAISGDIDVATDGTNIFAYNWNSTTQAVNGVIFTAPGTGVTLPSVSVNTYTFGSSSAPFAGLSSSYQGILSGSAWSGTTSAQTVTINNLTVGRKYEVQFWVDDSRGGFNSRTNTVTGGGGNTVMLAFAANGNGGALGQYTIGTFTADGTTQTITVTANNTFQINALQLRDLGAALPTVSLSANDANSSSSTSFNGAGNWNNGAAPSSANDYVVNSYQLRTPQNNSSYAFAGNSLTISGGSAGNLQIKQGTGYTVTVNNLYLDNAFVNQGDGSTTNYVAGNITLKTGGATLNNGNDATRGLWITAPIGGQGGLTLNTGGWYWLGNSDAFSGATALSSGTLTLLNAYALQNSTLNITGGGLVFDSSVGSHAFILGGLAGSANLALLDNAGTPNAVALTVGGNSASQTYSGVLSGSGSLTKMGLGTLTLSGNSTLTGGLTINNGIVSLSGSVSNVSGVTINGNTGNLGSSLWPLVNARNGALALYANGTPFGSSSVTMNNASLAFNPPGSSGGTATIQTLAANAGWNDLGAQPASAVSTLAIGNLVRTADATVSFRSIYGTLGQTGDNGAIAVTNLNGAALANANGILGGWAYAADNNNEAWNFARLQSSGNGIEVAPPTYTVTSSSTLASAATTDNVLASDSANGDQTLSANKTINSIITERDVLINSGVTLTLGSGGLIMSESIGDHWLKNGGNITSGYSNGSGTNDLFVNVPGNGGNMKFNTVIITDNSSTRVNFIKSGLGKLIMDTANTFSGQAIINGGTVLCTSGNYIFQTAGAITINGGATLQSDQNNNIYGTATSGKPPITINAGGALTTSGGATCHLGGNIILNGGTLASGTPNSTYGSWDLHQDITAGGNPASSIISALDVRLDPGSGTANSGGITFNVLPGALNGNDLVVNGTLNGGNKLFKAGAGKMVLSGVNGYSSGTEVQGGTLEVAAMSGIGTGYLAVKNGASFRYTGKGGETVSSEALWLNSGPSLVDIASATGFLTWSGSGGQCNAPFTKIGAGTVQFNVAFSGSAALTNNAGTLILAAANSHAGGDTVNGGTLQLAGSGTLGVSTNSLTINSGLLDLNGTSQNVGNLAGNGGGIVNNSGSGNVTLTIGNGDASGGPYSGLIADNTTGSGTVSLAKTGAGELTLFSADTFSGGLAINAGAIGFTNNNELGGASGNGAVTLNGGALKGHTGGTIAVAAARTITLGANGGYFSAGYGGNLQINAKLTGSGGIAAFNYDGSGYYYLTGTANDYTGDTWIGTTGPDYWNSGSAGAALYMNATNALPYGSGKGNVVVGYNASYSCPSSLDLNGFNTSINGLSNYTANASVNNSSSTAATLTVGNNNANSMFSGVIKNTGSGALSLVKMGTGTLNLSGQNTYTGNTTISAGTLFNAVANALPVGTTVNLAGGTLGMGASATVTALQNNGSILAKGTWGAAGSGANHISAAMTGSGILTVATGGASTISVVSGGASTYGSPVTFTATVTGSGGDGSTPSGTVTFYDGGASIGTGTLSGSGLSPTATLAISTLSHSGSPHSITASYAGNASYDVSTTSSAYSQTVNPLALTVSGASVTTKPYDGGTSATITGAALNGVVSGDTVNLGNAASGTFSTKNVGTGISVATAPMTISGASAGNYTLTQPALTGAITKTNLTITVAGNTKVYDSTTNAAATPTVSGLQGSDTVTGVAEAYTDKNAGTGKTLVVTAYTVNDGNSGNNYTVSTVSANTGVITTATPPAFLLTSSENPAGYRDSLTFVATNLPPDATSNVVFTANGVSFSTNVLANGGAASLAITNLPRAVTNIILAIYSGDNNYGSVSTNLTEIVTNHPPVASVMSATRTAGLRLLIALSDVATNWSDPDGDTVTLAGVNLVSTNGVTFQTNSTWILYTNSLNVNDQISYSIGDGWGGTNIGYVNIVINRSVTGSNSITAFSYGSSSNTVTAYGVIGCYYILERATNLASPVWVDLETNQAATNGMINATDTFWDLRGVPPPAAFYQLKWQP